MLFHNKIFIRSCFFFVDFISLCRQLSRQQMPRSCRIRRIQTNSSRSKIRRQEPSTCSIIFNRWQKSKSNRAERHRLLRSQRSTQRRIARGPRSNSSMARIRKHRSRVSRHIMGLSSFKLSRDHASQFASC